MAPVAMGVVRVVLLREGRNLKRGFLISLLIFVVMALDLFKSFLIGICAAVPVGPVLLLVFQKSVSLGKKAGLSAAVGSALVDTFYAALGLFALTLVSNFLDSHKNLVMGIGGIVLIFLGLVIIRKRNSIQLERKNSEFSSGFSLFGYGAQAVGTALTNPAAVLYVTGLLSVFGLAGGHIVSPVWMVLLAVACGEMFYWSVMVLFVFRSIKLKEKAFAWINTIAGTGISCIGLSLLVRGFLF